MKTIDPLARQVQGFAGRWDMLEGLVLCAVSGGRDSMVMLHLLAALAEEDGFQVAAAHFNHRLRPTADRDEAFVRGWCREKGVPLTCGAGDVRGFAAREGLGIEEAARTLRYAFLETAAHDMGAARIAAAHHREDNAETVLLHLLRGAGLQGLGGIAPVRGKIVRPLLEASRREIDAYAARNGVPCVEDESNRDTRFTRNRLRLEVLPLLEEMAPGCGGRIASMAELLREENEHMQREAEDILPPVENETITLPVPTLRKQDAALRRRLVRTMGQKLGAELTRAQAEAVLTLRSGGYLDLPGDLCAIRKPHQLILQKQPPSLSPLKLHMGEQTWGPWQITVRQSWDVPPESPDTIALSGIDGELAAALWDGEGRLAVENGSRTIKRLFADAGIPVERRREHPALLLDGKTAAVLGVAIDWGLRPEAGKPCRVVTFRKEYEEKGEHL
ncbi:MAG: tRNA lysidine(34) synthetase TilS [Oscillospiraceae bacterium]|nr:tRNA lysidine(34) synthetase TilS [Oscillospiraceae bacterium]